MGDLLMPPWVKWVAMLGLMVASGLVVGIKVHSHDMDAMNTYKLQVSMAAQATQLKSRQTEQAQATITQQKDTQYAQDIASLRAYYTSRMQHANGSSNLPKVPNAPTSIDAIPADSLPFAEQCGETTQQLIDLQQWVKDEASAAQ
jgi:hypothetical protein